ncbi:unnamed protein product [Victoria cruziana]
MAPQNGDMQGPIVDGRVQRTTLEADEDDSQWRFLEEIDAPMWVDLEAEAQLMAQDSLNPIIIQFSLVLAHCSDDAWFYTVHPFHQCSSHHFISSFSLFDKDNQERPDLSSPKLPGSVSGSRGKHYKKQSWAEATGITSGINASPAESDLLQHPIKLLGSKKSLPLVSVNDHSTKGDFTAKTPGKTSKISSGGTKVAISSCGDIAEKSYQRPAISRTSRPFSSGSGLLSAVKICLRKSCITGHASRIEINCGRHLKDQKTSSSKSSIGSSAITGGTSGSGGLGTSRKKERTPQSRMASITVNSNNGMKKAPKSTAAARTRIQEKKPNSKTKACATGTPKVLQTTTSRKPLQVLNSAAAPKLKTATKPKQSMSALKIHITSSTNIEKGNATKFFVQSKKDAACSAKLKDGKGAPLVKVIPNLSS